MLIHIHIPKNAGSTINTILKRHFQKRYVEFYTDRRGQFLSDSELIDLITTLKPRAAALSGHDIRPLAPDVSQDLGLEYITLIRHPIERAISLYYYERSLTLGQRDISQYPFDEYVVERPTYDNAISNWQTYNLTPTANFANAQKVLEHFLAVGVVHNFATFLLLLREKIKTDLEISHFKIWHKAANVSRNKELTLSTMSKKSFEKLLELNQEDIKLFEYATERLEQDVLSIPYAKYKTTFFKFNNGVYNTVRQKSKIACNYWYRGKQWLKQSLKYR